jgi:hypothetical protein
MWLGEDVESGFNWESYIGQHDENLPPQAPVALESSDTFAKRRYLTAIARGKQKAPSTDLIRAVTDPDVLVRRAALRAIAASKDPSAIGPVRQAMSDSENSVRCLAATTLAELPDSGTVAALVAAVTRSDSTYQFNFVAVPAALKALQKQGRLTRSDKEILVAKVNDANSNVREAMLYALSIVGAPRESDGGSALIRIINEDNDPYARDLAIVNLRSTYGPTTQVVATLLAAVRRDGDAELQVRAARAIAEMYRSPSSIKSARSEMLKMLVELFHSYGSGSQRSDGAWGWREVGNAIVLFGDDGRRALEGLIKDPTDRRLALLAWQVIYDPQDDVYHPTTEQADAEAHRLIVNVSRINRPSEMDRIASDSTNQ